MAYQDRSNGPAVINKFSGIPGEVLPPGSLKPGEIAYNVDGTLYIAGLGGAVVAVSGPGSTGGAYHREFDGILGANFIPATGEVCVNSESGAMYASDKSSSGGAASIEQRVRDGLWCQQTFNADGTMKLGQAAWDDYKSGTMYAFNPQNSSLVSYALDEIVILYYAPSAGESLNIKFSAGTGGTEQIWTTWAQNWVNGASGTIPSVGYHIVKLRANPIGTDAFFEAGTPQIITGTTEEWTVAVFSLPPRFNYNIGPLCNRDAVPYFPSCAPSCAATQGITSKHIIPGNVRSAPYFVDNSTVRFRPNPQGVTCGNVFYRTVPPGSRAPYVDASDGYQYSFPLAQELSPSSPPWGAPFRDPVVLPVAVSDFYAVLADTTVWGDIEDYLYDLPAKEQIAHKRWNAPKYQREVIRRESCPPRLRTWFETLGPWNACEYCFTKTTFIKDCLAAISKAKNIPEQSHPTTVFQRVFVDDNQERGSLKFDIDVTGMANGRMCMPFHSIGFHDCTIPAEVIQEVRGVSSANWQTTTPTVPPGTPAQGYAPMNVIRQVVDAPNAPTPTYWAGATTETTSSQVAIESVDLDGNTLKYAPFNSATTAYMYYRTSATTFNFSTQAFQLRVPISNGPYMFQSAAGETHITFSGDPEGKFVFDKDCLDLSQIIRSAGTGKFDAACYDKWLAMFRRLVEADHFSGPVNLGVSTKTKYTAAGAADRAYLVSQGWTITDGGQA